MSKAVSKLQRLERAMYKEWASAVRYCQEARNAYLLAKPIEASEKKATLAFSVIAADRAWGNWQTACSALDDIELAYHREPERP